MSSTIKKLQSDLNTQQTKNNGTQFTFKDIIGTSPNLLECTHHAQIAAQNTAPILIAGPTGTGKEVFAQSIHNASAQANMPFTQPRLAGQYPRIKTRYHPRHLSIPISGHHRDSGSVAFLFTKKCYG